MRTAIHYNCEPYAIFEGYYGLVKGGDMIKAMGWDDVRGYSSEGGTLIGTARCEWAPTTRVSHTLQTHGC